MKRLVVCVLTMGLLGLSIAGDAVTAEAHQVPVIKVGSALIYNAPVEVRPKTMGFGADGRLIYSHLVWSSWGGPIAKAHGVFEVNLGVPGAPYMHFVTVVEATDLQACDGRLAYTEIWRTTSRSVSADEPYRMSGGSIADGWHHCGSPPASKGRASCGQVEGELGPDQGETWSFFKTLATGTSCATAIQAVKQFGPLTGSELFMGKSGVMAGDFTCWYLERIPVQEPLPTSRCVRPNAEILLYNGGD